METRTSPRDEILRLLRAKGPLTAAEVARETGTVVSAARQHLGNLRGDGLVRAEIVRQGVGRPTHRFSLTAEADDEFPNDYRAIATALVSELAERGDDDILMSIFSDREADLIDFMRPQVEGLQFDDKVVRIAELMSERGYMTDVRAVDGGYELAAHNCPISAVTQQTDAPCRLELDIIENLLGVPITRSTSLANGQAACVYLIPHRQAG